MEHKTFALKAEMIGDGYTLSGYASTWALDLQGDRIEPGAFRETLKSGAGSVKFLWQHDQHMPLGKITSLVEDARGLRLTARISKTQLGKDAKILLDDGSIDGLSIGYDAVKASGHNPRVLKEIKLYEVSLVTFAANLGATVTDVKSQDKRRAMLAEMDAMLNDDASIAHQVGQEAKRIKLQEYLKEYSQ